MIKVNVYQDFIDDDGAIESGPRIDSFEVESLEQVKPELERRFNSRFKACTDGLDGAFENSEGQGACLVSNVEVITKIDQFRTIVNTRTLGLVEKQPIDLFSASAVIAVFDKLGPEARERFEALPVLKMVTVALKLIK